MTPDRFRQIISRAVTKNAKLLARLVNSAFTALGWTDNAPAAVVPDAKGEPAHAAESTATAVVLGGYGRGSHDVMSRPENSGLWRHHSVMDNVTTAICRCREVLTLPSNDPFWRTSWPALHWGCRSCVLPAPKGAAISTEYPTIPPATGFGRL